MKVVRRGYLPSYEKLFKEEGLEKIKEAGKDALYLLNRGYRVKTATMFVQQHYMLDEAQRLVIARCLATDEAIKSRKEKEVSKEDLEGKTIYIDGFNAIIPMESLVSNSPIFRCMDGAIRDMANLKGSYHIIDKTEPGIRLLFDMIDELKVAKAIINLDRPVSNSGRLKTLILEISQEYNVEVEVNLLDACDKSFYGLENVVSGDCVVIDNAKSWIPLYSWIVDKYKETHEVWELKF